MNDLKGHPDPPQLFFSTCHGESLTNSPRAILEYQLLEVQLYHGLLSFLLFPVYFIIIVCTLDGSPSINKQTNHLNSSLELQ